MNNRKQRVKCSVFFSQLTYARPERSTWSMRPCMFHFFLSPYARPVVLRDELAVRVQLPGQVVCVLVHHTQLRTEVERPPHRERVIVHNEEHTELALVASYHTPPSLPLLNIKISDWVNSL